jgi:hypothetical protein
MTQAIVEHGCIRVVLRAGAIIECSAEDNIIIGVGNRMTQQTCEDQQQTTNFVTNHTRRSRVFLLSLCHAGV